MDRTDVLALLAGALTDHPDAGGPLADALKEAGHEAAGKKLPALLGLPGVIRKTLAEARAAYERLQEMNPDEVTAEYGRHEEEWALDLETARAAVEALGELNSILIERLL
jgi:alkanesulfonate monooxygenase SsuD/methylene tetrahydromethanopterin reductase-like flavin-dependent oxidoreductase (luciferase family)